MQKKADCPYFGVDFSSLDNIVDPDLLFNQIDFMWCRAYGRDHTGSGDSQTAEFVAAARARGVAVGCYYFGFPIVDAMAGITTDAQIIANAETQAQQFIDKLYSVFGQGQVGDLIPILDLESYVDKTSQYGHTATFSNYYPQEVMTNAQITTWTLAFKNYFNTATGWRLGLYTGEYWIRAANPDGAALTTAQLQLLSPPDNPMPLWVARYDEYNSQNDTVPDFGNWTEFIAWQYTGTGDAAAYGIANDPPDDNNYLDLNRASDLSKLYAIKIGGESSLPDPQYVKDKALDFTSIEYETLKQFPDNYGTSSGNHDAMGTSFGAIQFNFGQGTLKPIFMHMLQKYWVKTKACFSNPGDFNTFEYNMWNYSTAQLVSWGNEITDWAKDPKGHTVKQPWKDYFYNIGVLPECIAKQQEAAETPYHVNARKFFDDFALWTRRGYALMFDISVQNGSINPKDANGVTIDVRGRIFSRFATLDTKGLSPEEIETEKMKIIVDERAKEVKSAIRPSYIERKSSIALGQFNVTSYGKWVYTEPYDLILEPAFLGYIKSDIHVVKSGDSFTTIAAIYNTDRATIEALNPSTDSASLFVGQAINVPYTEIVDTSPGKINIGSVSVKKIYLGSAEVTHVYLGSKNIYAPALPATTISPAEVVQNNIPITVTLTCDDPAATIYYKVGTNAEKAYTAPFTVNQNSTGVYSTQIPIVYWAVSENGTEEQKTITYDTTGATPSQPILTVTAETEQVTLSWTETTNTTSYTVFRSTVQDDPGTILPGTQYMTGRTWTDTTATGGTTYYYTVQAGNFHLATNSVQKAATPKIRGYRYIRQWMNGGVAGATPTNYNTILEFQAISAGSGNVLLNKVNLEGWVGKLAQTSNPASNITDGASSDMWSYCIWSDSTASRTPQKITYDMGAHYTDLTEIKTWHNFASAGRYYNFKIQICATDSPNDADWLTLFDAMNNEQTKLYEEKSTGFTISL